MSPTMPIAAHATSSTALPTTGGEALVDRLVAHGVRDLFMIPGIQLDWAVDALRRRSDEIALFVPRHEQSTAYMADGYYRASGAIGAAMVVPGPGVLNAGAALATAYASNSKVLFIAGQIHSSAIGRGCGLLHEIADQTGFIAGLTKWHARVPSADAIAGTVDQAFAALAGGRPRPVGVEIPHDYLSTTVAQATTTPATEPAAPAVDARAIDAAAALLDGARLPVLYVGGGGLGDGAPAAIRALAEKLGAPVVMSDNGRGALDDRHPMAMNTLAGRALLQHADVVAVVGSRFIDGLVPAPAWPAGRIRWIHVNLDASDVGPPRTPEIAIVGDAAVVLPMLTDRVRARVALGNDDASRVKAWARAQIEQVAPQAAYVAAIRDAMADDDLFVNELTQIGYLARIALPVYGPRTYIGPGYQGTLGYGFPVALGAAVGGGGRRVVSITGDGGFGWNLQELATARRYRLPVTLVVFNDGHYGNVRAIQKREFGAEVAVELTNPDFGLLANAFGVPFEAVDTPDALRGAIAAARSAAGPVMIEVRVGEMPSPWHLLRLQPMKGATGPAAPANPLDGSFA